MTTIPTYEQTTPRRPTIDDVGGGTYEDMVGFAPSPLDPSADDVNQMALLIVAAHIQLPHTTLNVQLVGGTPSIAGVFSMRRDILAGDFTVVDAGIGIVEITHTGGKLPPETWWAQAYVSGNAGGGVADVEKITNGWRVRTRICSSANLTDFNFVLRFSGV